MAAPEAFRLDATDCPFMSVPSGRSSIRQAAPRVRHRSSTQHTTTTPICSSRNASPPPSPASAKPTSSPTCFLSRLPPWGLSSVRPATPMRRARRSSPPCPAQASGPSMSGARSTTRFAWIEAPPRDHPVGRPKLRPARASLRAIEMRANFKSVRMCAITGGASSPALREDLRRCLRELQSAGTTVFDRYGSTRLGAFAQCREDGDWHNPTPELQYHEVVDPVDRAAAAVRRTRRSGGDASRPPRDRAHPFHRRRCGCHRPQPLPPLRPHQRADRRSGGAHQRSGQGQRHADQSRRPARYSAIDRRHR